MKPLGKVVDCNSKTFIDFNKKTKTRIAFHIITTICK